MSARERASSLTQQPPQSPGVKLPLIDAHHSATGSAHEVPSGCTPISPTVGAVGASPGSPTQPRPDVEQPPHPPRPRLPSQGHGRGFRKGSVEARDKEALEATELSDVQTMHVAATAALPHSHVPQPSQPATPQMQGYASPRLFRGSLGSASERGGYNATAPLSPSSNCTSPQFGALGSGSPGPGGGGGGGNSSNMEAARLRRKLLKLRAEVVDLSTRNSTLEAENAYLKLQLQDALRLASGRVAAVGARWEEEDAAAAAVAAARKNGVARSAAPSPMLSSVAHAAHAHAAHSYLSRARAYSALDHNVDLDQLLRVVPSPHHHPDVAAALHTDASAAVGSAAGVPSLSLAAASEERRASPSSSSVTGAGSGAISSDPDADPAALPQGSGLHISSQHMLLRHQAGSPPPAGVLHNNRGSAGASIRSPLLRAQSHASGSSAAAHAAQQRDPQHPGSPLRHSMPGGSPPLLHLHHHQHQHHPHHPHYSMMSSGAHTPATMGSSVFPSARSSYSSGVSTSSSASASSASSSLGMHPPSSLQATPTGAPIGGSNGNGSYTASPLLAPTSPAAGGTAKPAALQQPPSPSMQPSFASASSSGRFDRSSGLRSPGASAAQSPRFAARSAVNIGQNFALLAPLSIDTEAAAPHRRGVVQFVTAQAGQSGGGAVSGAAGMAPVPLARASSHSATADAQGSLSPLSLTPAGNGTSGGGVTRSLGVSNRRSSLTPGGTSSAVAAPSSSPLSPTVAQQVLMAFPGVEATAAGNGAAVHSWNGAAYPYPYPPAVTPPIGVSTGSLEGEAAVAAYAASPVMRGRSGSSVSGDYPSDAAGLIRSPRVHRHAVLAGGTGGGSVGVSGASSPPSAYEQSVSIARRLSCTTMADLNAATSMPMPPLLLSLAASNSQEQQQQMQQQQQALHAAGALPSPDMPPRSGQSFTPSPPPHGLPSDSPQFTARSSSPSSVVAAVSLALLESANIGGTAVTASPPSASSAHSSGGGNVARSGLRFAQAEVYSFDAPAHMSPGDAAAGSGSSSSRSLRGVPHHGAMRGSHPEVFVSMLAAEQVLGAASAHKGQHPKRAASEGAAAAHAHAGVGADAAHAGAASSPSSSLSSLPSSASTSRSASCASPAAGLGVMSGALAATALSSACHSPPPLPVEEEGEEESSGERSRAVSESPPPESLADFAAETPSRKGSAARLRLKRATARTDLGLPEGVLGRALAAVSATGGLPTAAVQIELEQQQQHEQE